MKILSILQAVIILLVLATAASCATGKEYADRVFNKRPAPVKDKDSVRLRFLEKDSVSFTDDEGYIAVQKEKKETEKDTLRTAAPEVIVPVPGPVNGNPERTRRKRD